MKDVLRQLYDGELYPAEQAYMQTGEYAKTREKLMQKHDAFESKLPPELVPEFRRILEDQLDLAPLEFYEVFSSGFRLGAKIMLAVLGHDDERA